MNPFPAQPPAPPPALRQAADLLAVPVRTDQDVLDRVAAIIDPAASGGRTLWLFFLDRDGHQANLVVPIDDIPERPVAALIGTVCSIASQALGQLKPGGRVVITLSRPGPARLTGSDRHFLRALQHGAGTHATPVRMLCLLTPAGVRELGPVRPG